MHIEWIAILVVGLAFGGCVGDDRGTAPGPSVSSPAATDQAGPTTTTLYFNGTVPAGNYRSGDFSRVQRVTDPFTVDNGTAALTAVLEFTAAAGDIDFHFERPAASASDALFGQNMGHQGSASSPAGGSITASGADVRPGSWTLVVHTCEAEPACANAEAQFSVRIQLTKA